MHENSATVEEEDENTSMQDKPNSYDNAQIRTKVQSGEFKLSQKRNRSRVWNVFAQVLDENGVEINKVVCRTCPSVYTFHGSTSNLVRHKCYIYSIRNSKSADSKKARYSTDEQESSLDASYTADDHHGKFPEMKKKLTEAVSHWVVHNCRPFDISDDSGLINLASILMDIGSNFGNLFSVNQLIPTTEEVMAQIEGSFEQEIAKVRSELSEARISGYSATFTSLPDEYMNPLKCATMHYVKDGSVVTRLLSACNLHEAQNSDKTGFRQPDRTMELLKVGEIPPAYVTSADSTQSVMSGGEHIQCICHLFNEIVERAFSELEEAKEMLVKANELAKSLILSGKVSGLQYKLVCYRPSQWNSIFDLLDSIESNWLNILELCKDNSEMELLDNLKLQDISSVTAILKQFEKCSTALGTDLSPTLHLVIPYVHRLRKVCSSPSSTELEGKLKHQLKCLLGEMSYEHIGKHHRLAMYLFPPTNQLLQCSLADKEQTIRECEMLMQKYCSDDISPNEAEIDIKQENEEDGLDDDLFADFVASHSSEDRISREIRRYADIEVPLTEGFDVLDWWHSNEKNFPLLFRVSNTVLAVPASSAPSRKALAKARNLISDSNVDSASNHEMVLKMLFIHTNHLYLDT